jgi:hypothetical protein
VQAPELPVVVLQAVRVKNQLLQHKPNKVVRTFLPTGPTLRLKGLFASLKD